MPGREQSRLWKPPVLNTGVEPLRQVLSLVICQGRQVIWKNGSISNLNVDIALTELEACGSMDHQLKPQQ